MANKHLQHSQLINEENIYDDLHTTVTEGGKSGEEKSKATMLLGRCLVGVVAVAAVLALALAVGAIVLVVTSNSNQEIQTLQLEIENLREMLNQTGDNSNEEFQSLHLEIENLREMLNQQLNTLRINNQAQDGKQNILISKFLYNKLNKFYSEPKKGSHIRQ